jgi:hypothetical protein
MLSFGVGDYIQVTDTHFREDNLDRENAWTDCLHADRWCGVCGATVGVVVSVHSSGHPMDTATVLGAYVAAFGVAVTVLMPVGAWWNKGRREKRTVSGLLRKLPRRLIG